jgi:hypothetical protein
MHVTKLHQQSSQLYMGLVLINLQIKNLYLTQFQASTKFKSKISRQLHINMKHLKNWNLAKWIQFSFNPN